MFEKLVALLPFNPSLAHDLAFYGRRMREESSIRRTGMVFIVLAFLVQFFAVLSPPQPTVADSVNDLINGGISSAAEAKDYCVRDVRDYKKILNYYGIDCSEVGVATTTYIKSTDDNGTIYSMGHKALGATHNGKPTNETAVNIPGASGTVYWRLLHSWDSGTYSTYKVLVVKKTAKHSAFYILYNCGNLAHPGLPTPYVPPTPPPPPPPPAPQVLSCSNEVMNYADNSTVAFNSSVIVRGQAAGQNIKTGQTVDMYYDYVNSAGKVVATAKTLGVPFSGTTANDSASHTFTANSAGTFTIRLTVKYDTTKVAAGSAAGNCVKHITIQQPCQYNSSLPADSPECKPCDKAVSSENSLACIELSKSANDTTAGWTVTNDEVKTANPGDSVTYTLTAKNGGKAVVKDFTFQEDISDVLDYVARNPAGEPVIKLNGGSLSPTGLVTWPAQDVPASGSVVHQITITVANPIPATPVSTSDTSHFDLVMTNTYGNTININVPTPPGKIPETVATTLPNTGPGTSMALAGAIFLIAGYFYSRSRLLATEVDIELQETTAGGI
jgi:uncharacterized repeat protein (TIGR01451 family)